MIELLQGPGEITILLKEERLDAVNSQSFLVYLQDLDPGDRKVAIDLRQIRHIDSSGLGALLALHKRFGAAMVLKNLSRQVFRVFELTNLTKVFTIVDA